MKTVFLGSFLKDVKKLKTASIRKQIEAAIVNVEAADSLSKVMQLKRLSGHQLYYRIRVGDYRIGLRVESGLVTFVRCLHRREVYRFFP